MSKACLVIMAAGIGSRFGKGIKQLEPVGPNGEIIMDYSIYDAMEAGFDKVVFVIRRDLENDFKKVIGNRIEKVIDVKYAYQEKDDIPEPYRSLYTNRKKPWGTGQAILCCKDVIHEPFLVINADDYYGKEAYKAAYNYLTSYYKTEDSKEHLCMVGFNLANTLSENGGVTRGICKSDQNKMLTEIVETYNIVKTSTGAAIQTENTYIPLDLNALVSMNMWGMYPSFFKLLDDKFEEFLCVNKDNYNTVEYVLPTVIGKLLQHDEVEVKVLNSCDKWFGVTYIEDKQSVVDAIQSLIENGVYPSRLFEA